MKFLVKKGIKFWSDGFLARAAGAPSLASLGAAQVWLPQHQPVQLFHLIHYRVNLETCDLLRHFDDNFGDNFWCQFVMTIFDDKFWWQFLMTIFDDNFLLQFLMTIFDANFWWQLLMTIFDGNFMMTIFYDNFFMKFFMTIFWWQYLMTLRQFLTIGKTVLETWHLRHWLQFWQLRTWIQSIILTWQLIVTLDSIRNSCDVF